MNLLTSYGYVREISQCTLIHCRVMADGICIISSNGSEKKCVCVCVEREIIQKYIKLLSTGDAGERIHKNS